MTPLEVAAESVGTLRSIGRAVSRAAGAVGQYGMRAYSATSETIGRMRSASQRIERITDIAAGFVRSYTGSMTRSSYETGGYLFGKIFHAGRRTWRSWRNY